MKTLIEQIDEIIHEFQVHPSEDISVLPFLNKIKAFVIAEQERIIKELEAEIKSAKDVGIYDDGLNGAISAYQNAIWIVEGEAD